VVVVVVVVVGEEKGTSKAKQARPALQTSSQPAGRQAASQPAESKGPSVCWLAGCHWLFIK
jgi:hypothetical protein